MKRSFHKTPFSSKTSLILVLELVLELTNGQGHWFPTSRFVFGNPNQTSHLIQWMNLWIEISCFNWRKMLKFIEFGQLNFFRLDAWLDKCGSNQNCDTKFECCWYARRCMTSRHWGFGYFSNLKYQRELIYKGPLHSVNVVHKWLTPNRMFQSSNRKPLT